MNNLILSNSFNVYNAYEDFVSYLDVSELTLKSYKLGIEQFMLYLKDNNIKTPNRMDVKRFRDVLKETKSINTVNSYMTSIRQFFKYLKDCNLYEDITQNVKSLRSSKVSKTQTLTVEKCKEIYSSLVDKREKAIWSLAITTGMRIHEIVNSKIENIKIYNNEIVLFHVCKKRDGETEYNKISQTVLNDIMEYVGDRKNGYIFVSESNNNRGNAITTTSARRIIKSILKRFDIDSDWVSCHSLRKTSATLAYLNGKSIYDIQQYLHHSSIATTTRYIQQITRDTNNTENMLSNLILG